jgi:hypothetical protein
VIDAIDEAVRTLIRRDALNGSDIEVVFDAPNKDWAARRNNPTINVYLYDIREDLKRRAYGITEERDVATGQVKARRPPARFFKFSYLVTAWTQRPEDEHRLLSAVLTCFLRYQVLPPEVLTGPLDGLKPVVVGIGMPPPDDRPVSDVWTALGGELKPSLDLTVTAPIDTGRTDTDIAAIVLEPRIRMTTADSSEEAPRGPGRSRRGTAAAQPARAVVTEEVIGGDAEQPGRTLRIRTLPGPGEPRRPAGR